MVDFYNTKFFLDVEEQNLVAISVKVGDVLNLTTIAYLVTRPIKAKEELLSKVVSRIVVNYICFLLTVNYREYLLHQLLRGRTVVERAPTSIISTSTIVSEINKSVCTHRLPTHHWVTHFCEVVLFL